MSFEDKQHVCSDCYIIATKAERERIIKLLDDIYDYPQGWNYSDPIASVIALIMGDDK